MTRLQPVQSLAEARTDLQQPDAERQQVHGPWLTTAEACDYLRYTGKHRLRSLYRFMEEQGIVPGRRGGTLLLARRDLDEALGRRRRG